MRKIAPLSRNAQHSNAANHLNLQGNVLAFCAECTNTEAFMKKLQAFSVIVLTLLGATFCQQRANPSSSNPKPADTPPTNISRTEVGPSLPVPFR
jgi:hypothetical protein